MKYLILCLLLMGCAKKQEIDDAYVKYEVSEKKTVSKNENGWYELYLNNTLLATCPIKETKMNECGVAAEYCDNGFSYACMQNIKYKEVTK